MKRIVSIVMLLAVTGAACTRATEVPAGITDTMLAEADRDAGNWLMYGRTYDDHRYSPLKQISDQTVARLGLAWSRDLDTTRGLEATPLVENGVIYTTGSWSVVHAI